MEIDVTTTTDKPFSLKQVSWLVKKKGIKLIGTNNDNIIYLLCSGLLTILLKSTRKVSSSSLAMENSRYTRNSMHYWPVCCWCCYWPDRSLSGERGTRRVSQLEKPSCGNLYVYYCAILSCAKVIIIIMLNWQLLCRRGKQMCHVTGVMENWPREAVYSSRTAKSMVELKPPTV